MSRSFLDRELPALTWRTLILWGVLSPVVAVVIFFTARAGALSAWVQAVGSVGAIAGAVWVSRLEAERARDERLMDAFLYIEKAFSVAAYAVESVKGAADYILKGSPTVEMLEYHASLLDIAVADLNEIKFTDMDNQMAAGAFLAIKRAANLTKSTITMRLRTYTAFDGMQVLQWGENVDREIKCMEQGIRIYLNQHPQVLDEITFPRF